MRPTNSLRLFQAVKPGSQQMRCLSTTASQRVADPRDQPASHRMEATEDQVSIVEAEQEPKGSVKKFHPEHQPDYRAHVDHGTGLYSPVPRKVQDGSEPGETLAAAVLSGAPVDLQARTVRIFKAAKPATQSGSWGSHAWRMDWDPLPKGHRWENPLMGWQSSADAMQGTKLQFKDKESAVAFAEKQGYEYYVSEPQERRFVPKAYANNFLYEPGPLKHIKTK
ncbi:ndufs4 NADH dehydrogenase Fe-S protein subunit [Lithohypha guttulata]|uniref:NADH dehydrogenase [ubiquinone] iron-sulfur protein 4, mitochondrial n=1 Tax=Lithohypha guttulata TaxID=1690604 RepID=A0ABR0KEN3_9EURO|nr:ndufs4 NADH dehydrogenase Fe-S protein subunit [Lithohypha guttulata]